MKTNQNNSTRILKNIAGFMLALTVFMPVMVKAAPLDLATIPLANSPTVPIQPNLLFIMDDSGSMSWDYMPDWANTSDQTLRNDAAYNTVYYNPATRYLPPTNFTSGGLDTATYPNQTGASIATGANFESKPNWRNVKNNPYMSTATTNLENLNSGDGPQFYVTIATEYCTRADLRECNVQSTPSATHPFAAPVRWCNSANNADTVLTPNPAAGACQAARVSGFTNLRMPADIPPPGVAIGTVTYTFASGSPRTTGITVGGQQIMADRTPRTNSLSNHATNAANQINSCTNGIPWGSNCTVSGYSATASGNTLTIYAPSPTTVSPVVSSSSGTLNRTTTAFAIPPATIGGRLLTTITPTNNSYPYPQSSTKAGQRTDCLGVTCTYAEEMTNYANWWAYYRTRGQLMKTATSLAFKNIGDDFRVGFLTTSTLGGRSLDIRQFTPANKVAWYAKLFSTPADRNTPLRGALSTAGRIYANKSNGKGTFSDPIQYECQQNFTLLTSDGFWNTGDETSSYAGGPVGLDGSTNVGNMDAGAGTPAGKREGTPARENTLADVAKYYRDTDLRTPALNNCGAGGAPGVCQTDNTASSPNKKQTMITMTLGLGVDGTLAYTTDYDRPSGDYAEIINGTKNWTDPIGNSGPERIDDLWHAAVNGDGKYFSASNPSDLVKQLEEAVASIQVKVGTGAAAATSTLNPISGDNFAYVASYTSGHWIGNLEKRTIDTATGEISTSPIACVEDVVSSGSCAAPSTILADGAGGYNCVTPDITDAAACEGTLDGTDCKVPVIASCNGQMESLVAALTDSRNIKMNVGGALQDFTFANLSSAQQTYFDTPFLAANLSQWATLTPAQQTNGTGSNLVAYLRGQTGFDQGAAIADNRVFRRRQATLGDLIDSKPAFIGKPTFSFGDPGYQTFKTNNANRAKTVFVGSNDGMLHAFDADTLTERWAFIPSMVIPNLWKLADTSYGTKHAYYVNGAVTISDICIAANCTTATASDWRTILIGGLNGGGRGYYALDITNPNSPTLLWEIDPNKTGFADLGYTFGNPVVTKRNSDNKWVVLFTSGYNNISDTNSFYGLSSTQFKPTPLYTSGNGNGYLYVVDAFTGTKLNGIATNVGNTTTPSGLAKIKAYSDEAEKNNVSQLVYGGDLDGNLWRFNIDTNTVFKLAKLLDGTAPTPLSQPVTTAPELGLVNSKKVVFVGTGKYLEVADLTNMSQQSLYAIKDDNAITTLTNARNDLAQQALAISSTDPDARVSSSNSAVNFISGNGWYVDFPDNGERQNVESQLVLGTLLTPTTVPTSTACQPAGYGWFNFLDYRTGLAVGGGLVSARTSAPSVGFNVVYINGVPKVSNVVADDKNPKLIPNIPFTGTGSGFQLRRSIWREIIE
jgi:type IV pilus assembly protein PilY1